MLRITKNIEEANLVTHTSTFHPDEVFCTMLLSKVIENPVVCRTNKVEGSREDAIIYDIGYTKFDHHQEDAEMRNEQIKYSAFGLIWREYGHKYLESMHVSDPDKLFDVIDEKLVMQIDGIDNGLFPKILAPYKLLDLDKIIDLFNKSFDEEVDNDDNFMTAVSVATLIFDRIVLKEDAIIRANKKALEIIKEQLDKDTLILPEYMPYEDALFSVENNFKTIIFPSNRGGYNIKIKTVSRESKELAFHFPEEYLGKHDEELEELSGIKTLRFCHSSGFLAATDTFSDALELAKRVN